MFKKLVTKIKLFLMGNYINKLFAPLLQFFKVKSPKAFLAFATVATVLQFGLNAVLTLVIPGVTLPADFLSLVWIIKTFGWTVDGNIIQTILWFLALVTGSSSSAWLDPNKRSDLVEESKLNAKEADVLRSTEPVDVKREKILKVREEKRAMRQAKKANK